jgi:hypothetical protein
MPKFFSSSKTRKTRPTHPGSSRAVSKGASAQPGQRSGSSEARDARNDHWRGENNPSALQSRGTEKGRAATKADLLKSARVPKLNGHLQVSSDWLQSRLGSDADFVERKLVIGRYRAACYFLRTLIDKPLLERNILQLQQHAYPRKSLRQMTDYLVERVLSVSEAMSMHDLQDVEMALLKGYVVIAIEGCPDVIAFPAKSVEHRSPEPPMMESSSRGSQISFVESLDLNIALIRELLSNGQLRVRRVTLGTRSQRDVAVIYLEDVANPTLIQTMSDRLQSINIDLISQGSAVENRIVGDTWTLFPLTRTSTRVDNVIREVNQGKVVLMVDGDPTSMLFPSTIHDFFQTEEDYAHTTWEATFIRFLRIIAFVFALYLPSLYIAFVDFNPELLPKLLGFQIAKSRESVPFPAVVEVVTMQIFVEILREATLRMPKQMGQTLGIVGGLVVGEATVQAGIVSNILIVVIALSAISVFVTPSYEFSTTIRLMSWPMILGATVFGLYGIVLVTIIYLYEIASLKSFGVSYMAPYNGENLRDAFIDGIIRIPVIFAKRRASYLHPLDANGEQSSPLPDPYPQLEKSRRQRRRRGSSS